MRQINQASATGSAGLGEASTLGVAEAAASVAPVAPGALLSPRSLPPLKRRDPKHEDPDTEETPPASGGPPKPERAPAPPRRPRFPFRLTKLGSGTLVLIVLITGAAVNTGTNLLYLMLSSLASLWTITFAIYWLNFHRLKTLRRIPGEIYADQPTELRYEAINERRRIVTFGVSVLDPIQTSDPPVVSAYFLAVPPRKTVSVTAQVRFKRRGWADLPDLYIVSSFPFGFLDARLKRPAKARALVFPAILPLEAVIRRQAVKHGMSESSRKGAGASLYAIRDYVWGDSARSIHWKLSSKGVGVKVREFESEDTRRFRIVLDEIPPSKPEPEALERFELAVSVAASLARVFIRDGFSVSLWTPGGVVTPGEGGPQFRRIATTLALLEWRDCVGARQARPSGPADEEVDVPVSAFLAEAREIARRDAISG